MKKILIMLLMIFMVSSQSFAANYKKGDRVRAMWTNGLYYKAKIQGYDKAAKEWIILYDDGTKSKAKDKELRPFKNHGLDRSYLGDAEQTPEERAAEIERKRKKRKQRRMLNAVVLDTKIAASDH